MDLFPWTRARRHPVADWVAEPDPATLDHAIDLIAQINHEIHSAETDDLEALAGRVVASMGHALRCIGGALLLVEEDEAVLRPFVYSSISIFVEKVIPLLSKSFQDYRFDLKKADNFSARTAIEGRTFVGNDYAAFVSPTLSIPLARRIQRLVRMRTIATAPAMLGGRVLGVLMVGFREEELQPGRCRLLELFAGQCAVAIHNAKRREKVLLHLQRERELTVRLRAADKMKGDLLLMAGHELGTPLAAVRYGLEAFALSPAVAADPNGAKTADQLISQIAQLNALVDDMCQALKASQDELEVSGKMLRLDLLLRQLVARRSTEFEEHRATVTVLNTATEAIPPVLGDEARLRYAFWELITNAIKHGGHGVQVEIRLEQERREDSDGVRVDVRDSGHGISEEIRDRLFGEQFVVGPKLDQKSTPGMGIGLYLVNKIVELHRGTITITSTRDQYTSVVVWLPVLALRPDRSP